MLFKINCTFAWRKLYLQNKQYMRIFERIRNVQALLSVFYLL